MVTCLVAHQQQAQPVVAHDFERLARHICLGVTRPGHAELAQFARDRFGARAVVGEGVVVEEEFLDLRKIALRLTNFLDHMTDTADAIAVPPDRLRPQAEGAFRPASASGVERHVGVLQVTDEVILDPQIALVDFGDERQPVHVLEYRPVGVVGDDGVRAAEAQTVDCIEPTALGDFLDGEIELLAGDKVDGRGCL